MNDGCDYWRLASLSLCYFVVSGSWLMSMARSLVTVALLVWSDAVTCLDARSKPPVSFNSCIFSTLESSIQARAKSSLGRRATEYPRAGSRTGERGPREGILRERGPGKPIRRGVNGACS